MDSRGLVAVGSGGEFGPLPFLAFFVRLCSSGDPVVVVLGSSVFLGARGLTESLVSVPFFGVEEVVLNIEKRKYSWITFRPSSTVKSLLNSELTRTWNDCRVVVAVAVTELAEHLAAEQKLANNFSSSHNSIGAPQ